MADVTVKMKGDSSDLVRELGKVESALDGVEGSGKRMSGGLDPAIDKFDDLDTKAMGFRDSLTGVEDTMAGTAALAEGDLFKGLLTLGMGIGDLASGMVNLVLPALKSFKLSMVTTARTAMTTAATHVAAAARQVAAWVVLGAQATAQAIKVAAAWLISMGPIIIVGAAIIALTVLVVKNFDKIKGAIEAVFNWVKDNWDKILIILLGPFGLAVTAIIKHRDDIVDAIKAVPGMIAGVASTMWNGIKDSISTAKSWVTTRVTLMVSSVIGIPGRIANVASTMFNGLKNAITSAWEWYNEKINLIVNTLISIPGRLAGKFSGMFDGIKEAFIGVINFIIGAWNGLEFTIPAFDTHIPGVGKVGGQTIGVPDIPKIGGSGSKGGGGGGRTVFHSGGTFRADRPGGEGLALLSDRERVLRPGEPMPTGMGGGGGQNISITVNAGMGTNGPQVARMVADEVRKATRRGF